MKTTFVNLIILFFLPLIVLKANAAPKPNQPPVVNAYISLVDPNNLRSLRVSLINSTDSDGDITKYQINFGDGYISTKADDQHQYTRDGAFTITAKVWDNKNATTEYTKVVQIKSNLVFSQAAEAVSIVDIKKSKQYSFNVSANYVNSLYKIVVNHRENSSKWGSLLAWLNDLIRRLLGQPNAKLEFVLKLNNINLFAANEVKDDTLKIEKLVSLNASNVIEAQFKNAEDDRFDVQIFRLNVTEDVLPPIIASDIQSGGITRNNQLPIRVSDLSGTFTTTVWKVNQLAQLAPPNDSNATYQYLFTTTESNFNIILSEGYNNFVLQSVDGFGHVSYYFYLSNIILDTRGPGIALSRPANVSTVYVNQLPIQYEVRPVFSEAISRWTLNGTNYLPSPNNNASAIGSIARSGANSFTVTATDVVGNTSTITQNFNVVQVSGETTLDNITFNTPYRNLDPVTNTRHVSFNYKVNTPLPEVEIKFFLNGLDDDGESIPFATSYSKQGTLFVDLPANQDRNFVLAAVYAKNAGYNGFFGVYGRSPAIDTTAQQILFETGTPVDTVPPQLVSSLPTSGSVFYVNSLPQQKNLQLLFNEPLSQIKINNGVAVPMLSASSYQSNFSFAQAGVNQIQIEATDLAGNIAHLTYTLDFNFSDTKPVIKFDDAVVNMLTNLVTVPVSGTSDKPLNAIKMNGQPLTLAAGDKSFSGYFDAPANGRFRLQLEGTDKWGNVGTAETYIRVLQQLPDRLLHPEQPILRYDETTRTYTPDFGNPFKTPQTDGTCDVLDQIFNSEIEFKDYLATMDRNSRQRAYDTINYGHKNFNTPSKRDLENFMGEVDETLNDLKAPYLIMCKGYNIDPDQACEESRHIFRILMGTYPEPLIIRSIPGIPLSVQDFLIRRTNICTGFDTSGLTCDEMVKFMPLVANLALPSLGQLMGSPAGQFVTEAFVCKDKCDNPLTASSPECLIKSLPQIPSVGPLPIIISLPGAPIVGSDFGGGDTWHGGGGSGGGGGGGSCGGFFSFCGGGGGGGIDIDIGSGDFVCSMLPDLFPCGGGENSSGTDRVVIDIGNVDCAQLSSGNIGSLVTDAASRGLPLMTSFSTYLAKCLVSPVPNYPHIKRPVITVLTPVQNQQAEATTHVTGYVDDFYAVVRVNGVDVTTRSGFQGAYFDVTVPTPQDGKIKVEAASVFGVQAEPVYRNLVKPNGGITDLAVAQSHTCFIKNGAGYCWGENSYGQLGDGSYDSRSGPTAILGLGSGVDQIATGKFGTCALKAGQVYCWGEYPMAGSESSTSAKVIQNLGDIAVKIAVGDRFACAVLANGALKCWGYQEGGLGDGVHQVSEAPIQVNGLASGVTNVAVKLTYACASLDTGEVKCWGSQDGRGISEPELVLSAGPRIDSLAVSNKKGCVISGSDIKCWGTIDSQGTYYTVGTKIDVSEISSNISNIALSYTYHYACLVDSGAAHCWYSPDRSQFTPTNLTSGVQKIYMLNQVGYALVNGDIYVWTESNPEASKINIDL